MELVILGSGTWLLDVILLKLRKANLRGVTSSVEVGARELVTLESGARLFSEISSRLQKSPSQRAGSPGGIQEDSESLGKLSLDSLGVCFPEKESVEPSGSFL